MKIAKRENNYLILKDNETPVILTCNEVSLLINFVGKENLRYQIDDRLQTAEWDWLDITKYQGTRDEFIQEIFEELEDEIDYGNSVSDDYIDERISDLAMFYDLEKDV